MAKAVANRIGILRKANKSLVLNCLINHAPLTIEDIISKTSMSRPTVVKLVNELIESGYVIKKGFDSSTGGRSPALFQPSYHSWFAVGVDFEFPAARFAVADMAGKTVADRKIVFPFDSDAEIVKNVLYETIEELIEEAGIDRNRIIGIGIGLSGLVDSRKGVSRVMERIRGWRDVDLKNYLRSRGLGVPIYIANDVHLLGFVEQQLYLNSSSRSFIYVGLRSGIGSLIVKNGRMWEGEYGNAGFIGHMTMNPDGPACRCGSRGCLDTYSGQLALAAAYDAAQTQNGRKCNPSLEDLIRFSRGGDEVATDILKRAGYTLGVAISNMVKIVEIPEVIIGACEQFESSVYFSEVQRGVKEFIAVDYGFDVSIRCGVLTEAEYPLGGCFFAFGHMVERPELKLSV